VDQLGLNGMNGQKTRLPLMKLGEKENALDALWTNNNLTHGLGLKETTLKKNKENMYAYKINFVT
jgi:hypothetical protein